MTYERIAQGKRNIKEVRSANYIVTNNEVKLVVNQTQYVGSFPSLGAAKEALNGLLIKNGCSKPFEQGFRILETIEDYQTGFTTQNSQTGNTVGTMFTSVAGTTGQPATNGIVSLANSNYVQILTEPAGTFNSRARLINESDAYGVLAADVWKCINYKVSRFTAKVNVSNYNVANWKTNQALVGFSGSHAGTIIPTEMSVEKGLCFRPNSNGKWRCSWFSKLTYQVFQEVAYFDTEYKITDVLNLSIWIEEQGKTATFLIEGKPIWTVSIRSEKISITDNVFPPEILGGLVYSVDTDSFTPIGQTVSTNSAYSSYVGCDVRVRTAGSAQFSIQIYNSKLETR